MAEPLPLRDHPQRQLLSDEVHARPYMRLVAPERASHLALFTAEEGRRRSALCWQNLLRGERTRTVCQRKLSSGSAGRVSPAVERHTEFSTYGFFGQSDSSPLPRG